MLACSVCAVMGMSCRLIKSQLNNVNVAAEAEKMATSRLFSPASMDAMRKVNVGVLCVESDGNELEKVEIQLNVNKSLLLLLEQKR